MRTDYPQAGVCKTRTGYLRMADADGKMRIVKGGYWKKLRRRVTTTKTVTNLDK